jgi:mannose-6-phosphate isomerase-like protein (cupin superfamily)
VLSGQLEITVAGKQVTLGQGDAFTFPADTRHTFRGVPQAGRTQVLWIVSPALPDAPLYAPPSSQ